MVLGAALTYGTRQLSFEAQELIGGTASIIAVGFVTAMVFWMKSASRTISGELKGKLDRALDLGPVAVALVAFLGVGREGLETAIFFYATAQAAGAGNNLPLLGWVVGFAAAVLLGWLHLPRRPADQPRRRSSRGPASLLILVAAGILTYGIHDLQEAGVLPGLNNLAFDVSGTVDPEQLVRHPAQGHLQLHAGHHRAAGRRLGALRRHRDVPLPAPGQAARPRTRRPPPATTAQVPESSATAVRLSRPRPAAPPAHLQGDPPVRTRPLALVAALAAARSASR